MLWRTTWAASFDGGTTTAASYQDGDADLSDLTVLLAAYGTICG